MRRLARTNHTLLLVCEGYAEVELARHMRECFLPRDCGTALEYLNARGNACDALKMVLEQKRQTGSDTYGVLIDTDAHWNDEHRREAAAVGIVCIENHPCLEATLLAVGGHRVRASAQENKNEFSRIYGDHAHRPGLIARAFSADNFDDARARIPAIDCLLRFLRHE